VSATAIAMLSQYAQRFLVIHPWYREMLDDCVIQTKTHTPLSVHEPVLHLQRR